MDRQRVRATLPAGTVYVYGTVNGEERVWTNTAGDVWEADAPRSPDDTYQVSLQVYNGEGKYYTAALTLYYGVLNLIYDRTQADVDRAEYLSTIPYAAMSPAEQEEWNACFRGAYNAADLNRVGSAVDYIAGRFREYGYSVKVSPKKDWKMSDIPTPEQMQTYLDNVAALRKTLSVFPTTPSVPPDMDDLTWQEANNIERILWDINLLINYMISSWYYSGELFCGEVT